MAGGFGAPCGRSCQDVEDALLLEGMVAVAGERCAVNEGASRVFGHGDERRECVGAFDRHLACALEHDE